MSDTPAWHIAGDWFDNCSCAVACPCTFAQAPDNGFCESVLFWHIRAGHYGATRLDDPQPLALEAVVDRPGQVAPRGVRLDDRQRPLDGHGCSRGVASRGL